MVEPCSTSGYVNKGAYMLENDFANVGWFVDRVPSGDERLC